VFVCSQSLWGDLIVISTLLVAGLVARIVPCSSHCRLLVRLFLFTIRTIRKQSIDNNERITIGFNPYIPFSLDEIFRVTVFAAALLIDYPVQPDFPLGGDFGRISDT
jgi:hypothetical protein